MIRAGGKALGTLQRLGASNLRPAWQEPFKIYWDKPGVARPSLLLQWSEAKGYSIQEGTLREILPDCALETVMGRLRN